MNLLSISGSVILALLTTTNEIIGVGFDTPANFLNSLKDNIKGLASLLSIPFAEEIANAVFEVLYFFYLFFAVLIGVPMYMIQNFGNIISGSFKKLNDALEEIAKDIEG